ncbi:ABL189Wp [Eremothecium gossypii ATCC 10895]|uniref:Altered inheritance of mitochondria protein 6 n=1 Tax=Eremothecium gossypii (strain ATCC 10895 / CBS 109.51 / FGSC 9923 / NRRL Y-1056) TaxID=284811 RepID=AIM6_EREGS|nr:ABL189Wp [Eremothecium gossypii ATCC 10895]Q75E59.1 RecName: Full=Altered inheritance of mitochondria protein 6; Flags: Precursor [Eremothecium gossypii ATCC 10895]AAS50582.1 ABL189Wp [Eremothecium gossypii ATCC 10895]AEY94870.1 FABL189Wp [Eremothecium gossypii FDAG1]
MMLLSQPGIWLLVSLFLCSSVNSISLWKSHPLVAGSNEPDQKRPDTPSSPRPLGITGAALLNYFEQNLRTMEVPDTAGVPQDSAYYTALTHYLGLCGARSENCDPGQSAVAKLTRDVPVLTRVHSHNDYWRRVPLLQALAYGVASVEADVWLENNGTTLLVGHNRVFLEPAHDLGRLYIEPITRMLQEVNCKSENKGDPYGIFYNAPEEQLLLYIDFKSLDRKLTYKLLLDYLKPLIDNNFISYYDMDAKRFVSRPVTVVLTGNYPSDEEIGVPSPRRYTFLDAPLGRLSSVGDEFTANNVSVVASSSLLELMLRCGKASNPSLTEQTAWESYGCLVEYVREAHRRDLRARIWGLPDWPVSTRENLWDMLTDMGVDYLNVDDLDAVSKF